MYLNKNVVKTKWLKMKVGLTFTDVLLVPKKTPLRSRTEADIRTRFTKNISLNIPLISANMATVTEHRITIAILGRVA